MDFVNNNVVTVTKTNGPTLGAGNMGRFMENRPEGTAVLSAHRAVVSADTLSASESSRGGKDCLDPCGRADAYLTELQRIDGLIQTL